MYYDPVNTVVGSAALRQPVTFQHRLSGSYLSQSDDLQLRQDPLTGERDKDKRSLWLLNAYSMTSDGTVLYRVINVDTENVMAIWHNPDNPSEPPINRAIEFQTPTEDKDINSTRALSQLWLLQPVEDKSHAISPARFPELSLGVFTNNPGTTSGCDRIPPKILPHGGDNDNWLHHHRVQPYPRPQKDPASHANCETC